MAALPFFASLLTWPLVLRASSSVSPCDERYADWLTDREQFERMDEPRYLQGLHVLCLWREKEDGPVFLEAQLNGIREENPFLSELPPDVIDADWGAFRKHLQYLLHFTKATNEWGNFHLKQPFGLFEPGGRRLASTAEVLDAQLVLLFEGGQWFWPPVRVGYVRALPGTTYELKTVSVQPVVFLVRGFLREEECQTIIAMGEANMSESPIVPMDTHHRDKATKEFRTSTQARLESSESPLLTELDHRISNLTRVPVHHNEEVQILRYRLGEFYAAHTDNFDPQYYQNSVDYIDKGHRNRLLTVFWYLTNVSQGGQTLFPRAHALPQPEDMHSCEKGLKVQPEIGAVLLWYSLRPNGNSDPNSLHASCPVQEGMKWSANYWVWNKPRDVQVALPDADYDDEYGALDLIERHFGIVRIQGQCLHPTTNILDCKLTGEKEVPEGAEANDDMTSKICESSVAESDAVPQNNVSATFENRHEHPVRSSARIRSHPLALSATMKLGSIRLLLAWAFIFWTSGSFKLVESPLAMTNSTNETANRIVEEVVAQRLHADMEEISSIDNPASENQSGSNESTAMQGPGELARNLEFLLIKVAQLEAVAEMQQAKLNEQTKKIVSQEDRIQSLEKKVNGEGQKSAGAFVETEHKDAQTLLNEATDVLKNVMLKHNRQRQKGMLHERHRSGLKGSGSEKEAEESARFNPLDLVPKKVRKHITSPFDKLVDGFQAAADKAHWLATNTVDTLALAVNILSRGFTDFRADCDGSNLPSFSYFDQRGLRINFGNLRCEITLMGQTTPLFGFDFGWKHIPLPSPTQLLGGNIEGLLPGQLQQIVSGDILGLMPGPLKLLGAFDCAGQADVVQCLGFKIISDIAPLNFLTRLGDIFKEFIESFAKLASKLVAQAMKGGQSLLQTAATTEFPSVGKDAVVHHRGPNLVITKHSQKMPGKHAELLQKMANLEEPKPPAAVKWSFEDYGPETQALVTQLLVSFPLGARFNGRETSTGSCLAFAPRSKTGSNNQATEADWQAQAKDDFVQLEPWAVPCGNQWMKDHWDKWQGYSFYSVDTSIEKCLTVTFALNMQPVAAFVGGIEFDLLPGPLAEIDTQVCWPRHQPGGLDLSVLRSVIRSNGVLLFSRTLRLSKRFGNDTHFVTENVHGGHQTSRSFFGTSATDEESGTGMASMKRSSLLESNQSRAQAKARLQESLRWETDEEDLYLASVKYGEDMGDMGMNKTSEIRGSSARKRLSSSVHVSEQVHLRQLQAF
ncbi:P4H4 [Symbiodinium necroappetens]|uniref:P4H4 protein n=1 Tax=Symbiodinium necroappetens TaxID=1628268 RepID=A0A813AQD6_9DINO|nr:P4H4 [Symbiodinium necroappetens]